MNNKKKYQDFVDQYQGEISVFLHPWYIESVLDDDSWDVSLYIENDNILGFILYYRKKHNSMRYIQSVPLMPAVNLFIKPIPNQKDIKRRSYERKVLAGVFENIRGYDSLRLKLSAKIVDWRSLYWTKIYTQSTAYSSRILNTSKTHDLLANFKNTIRTDLKKSSSLSIIENPPLKGLYNVLSDSFRRKKKETPYSENTFNKLYKACGTNGVLKCYAASYENTIVGCIVCIEDYDCYYYILGGLLEEYKHFQSQTLLIYHAIIKAISANKHFDFEGSMDQNIDRFFMSFNPSIVPSYVITHDNSKMIMLKKSIMKILKHKKI